jgi:hypothetical protein
MRFAKFEKLFATSHLRGKIFCTAAKSHHPEERAVGSSFRMMELSKFN